MITTVLKPIEAKTTANSLFVEYVSLIEGGNFSRSDLDSVIASVELILSSTNIAQYPYPLSILNRISLMAREEKKVFEADKPPEDIHYMNTDDLLLLMAEKYYGNVDAVVSIMKNNGVYSTDEAIRLGLLRVISREETII